MRTEIVAMHMSDGIVDVPVSIAFGLVAIAGHDLPYALQLCPRSVVIDDGVVVADAPTHELLADEAFLREHRLELPFGFTPSLGSAG